MTPTGSLWAELTSLQRDPTSDDDQFTQVSQAASFKLFLRRSFLKIWKSLRFQFNVAKLSTTDCSLLQNDNISHHCIEVQFCTRCLRDGNVWFRIWSKSLVEILKMKFGQDLCLNLWHDPIGYFEKMNSTLGSVVHLAMFFYNPVCVTKIIKWRLTFFENCHMTKFSKNRLPPKMG